MMTRAQTIAELQQIRATAMADLMTCPPHRLDSEWAADRRHDVTYADRKLERLGAELTPAERN